MASNDPFQEMGVRLKPKVPVSETGNDSVDIVVSKNKKIFNDYFLQNGVHNKVNDKITRKFEKKVWALVEVEKKGVTFWSQLYESKKGRCAERLAIKDLRADHKTALDKCKIKMYISFSPCFTCCGEIIQLKYDFNMEGKIIFSAFYKIRQDSCIEHIGDHPLPETSDHDKSVNGLKALVNNGFHVSPFSEDELRYIAQLLEVDFDKVPDTLKRTRLEEDEVMRRDFEIIMRNATNAEGLSQMGVTVTQPTVTMKEVTGLDDTSDFHIKR